MASNPITIIKQTDAALSDLNAKLDITYQKLVSISKEARKAGVGLGRKASSSASSNVQNRNIAEERLNSVMKEQQRIREQAIQQLGKHQAALSRWNALKQDAIIRTRTANRLAREEAILNSAVSREYDKLVVKMNQAGRAKQDLVAKQSQGIRLDAQERRLLRQKSADFAKYEAAVKKADAAINRHYRNVGNYTSALGKLRSSLYSVMAAFGLVGGLTLFAQTGIGVFNLVKKLDSLRFAMQAVIKDSLELTQTQKWLKDITDNFGAELVTTTERYIKFRAAAQNAGFTALQTQRIFETMTKVSGVLGLRTDELQGIYLALEQMISKGKITTEELRRQLGERLPAAMDIMAQSMGVTTAELDRMMKAGEVITKDVLPAFALKVQEVYGLENIKRVQTLTAANMRLKNAWTDLVTEFNKGNDVSTKLMNIFDFFADNLKEIVDWVYRAVKAWVIYKAIMLTISTVTRVYTAAVFALRFAKIALSQGIRAAAAQMLSFNAATKANPLGALLSVIAAAIALFITLKDKIGEAAEAQENYNKAVENGLSRAQAKKKQLADAVEAELAAERKLAAEKMQSAETDEERAKIQQDAKEKQIALLEENIRKNEELFKSNEENYAKEKEIAYNTLGASSEFILLHEGKMKAFQSENEALAELNLAWKDQINILKQSQKETLDPNSVAGLKEQIKAQEELLEGATKRAEAIPIQKEIARLENEITKILGEKNKARKDEAMILEGSIAFYEDYLKKLQDEQARLATTTEAYQEYGKAIEAVQGVIDTMKDPRTLDDILDNLEKINDEIEAMEINEELFKFENHMIAEGMDNLADELGVTASELFAEFKDLYEWDWENFQEFANKKLEKFKDDGEKQKEAQKKLNEALLDNFVEFIDNIKELGSTVYEKDIQEIDDKIEKTKDYYAQILDSESLTEQERSAIEAERNVKIRQLEKKKRQEQIRQAKFEKALTATKVIIETASAVAEANPNIPLMVFAAAQGAVQLATVLAQPIPKYEKGKGDYDNYEGAAIWGEKRRELKISKDGSVEISPKRIDKHLTYVKKDDVIHPDADRVLSKLTYDDIVNKSFDFTRSSSPQISTTDVVASKINIQNDKLVNELRKKKLSVKINQTIALGDEIAFLNKKNNTL